MFGIEASGGRRAVDDAAVPPFFYSGELERLGDSDSDFSLVSQIF